MVVVVTHAVDVHHGGRFMSASLRQLALEWRKHGALTSELEESLRLCHLEASGQRWDAVGTGGKNDS